MSAVAALAVSDEAQSSAGDVLIHVRYSPNSEIFFMDACPAHLAPKDWLKLLLAEASDCYQVRAGGRGFFRIPRARFEAISAKAGK